MKLYPGTAAHQLEFEKIKMLLSDICRSDLAKAKAESLRIHTRRDYIEPELNQTREYKLIFENELNFPDDVVLNLHRELRLLQIENSMLSGPQFLLFRRLTVAIQQIFRWFDHSRRDAFPFLARVIQDTYFEKSILGMIDEVLGTDGRIKDNASEVLRDIRISIHRKNFELRRLFDRIVNKMNKQGYLAEIEESFMNGRRVLAVFAEQKRMIKGILHGESDSRRTAFIEPEETIGLNNEINSLEMDEQKEVHRILKDLTAKMRLLHPLLETYDHILGEYDFIRAKARLAVQYNGNMPAVSEKSGMKLIDARHPLLYLYNIKLRKPTIPVNLTLNETHRILVISGPNAGGKTVTLKTAGLLQMMMQSGLLVPCSPESELGIFRQLMIHIGDTQSLEFELSTYSSHLLHMKYFMDNANGKTLFFIDELGSGSDPNLGGAFAEVILEELARRHAIGIVTTHYLNLKVMGSVVPGMINGAMAFDEKNLQPLYQLMIGKPGSSYTFSIAERIGLPKHLIEKAKGLVNENHFSLDRLLNRTEQDMQQVASQKKRLEDLILENENLKKELETDLSREKHRQQLEILIHKNKFNEEKFLYLKEMERKIKSLLVQWRSSDDKQEVIKMMHSLFFRQREKQTAEKRQKKFDTKYIETPDLAEVGNKVKIKINNQVGILTKLRGKKAIVQVGAVPITVDVSAIVVVKDKLPESEV